MINLGSPDDLAKAMKLAEKRHLYEGQHYTVDAERNCMAFFPEYSDEQQELVKAMRGLRFDPRGNHICFSVGISSAVEAD
jgi:hypothetical protein